MNLSILNPIRKTHWAKVLITMVGLIVAPIAVIPTQADAYSSPVITSSTLSFTLSEDSSRQVLSGIDFGASDSDGNIISFHVYASGGSQPWWLFSIRNKNTVSTTGTQHAEITYLGNGWDYETASVFDDQEGNGRRGHEFKLYACVGHRHNSTNPKRCSTMNFRGYVTDVTEIETMSGYIRIVPDLEFYYAGDTVTADFSRIDDGEGVNNLSIAWSREVCPAERNLGGWPIRRRISSADDSDFYELTNSESNQTISIWGQYQTDNGNNKWVCKNIQVDAFEIPPEPVINNPPEVGYGPWYYYVEENSNPGTLSADIVDPEQDKTPSMVDMDQETLTYVISIPEGTNNDVADTINSAFRVRNTAPNPATSESAQTISISSTRSFDYETAPELGNGEKGYQFNVKGYDLQGEYDTVEIYVYVTDVAETSTVTIPDTTSPVISNVGQVLRYGDQAFPFKSNTLFGLITWRRGGCTAGPVGNRAIGGSFPTGSSYTDVGTGSLYTVQPADVGHPISVWANGQHNRGRGAGLEYLWYCKVRVSEVAPLPMIVSGQPRVGETLAVDFSNLADAEGVNALNITWRRGGACTSSTGTGNLPQTDSSGKSYTNLQAFPYLHLNARGYRVSTLDVNHTLSAWGVYTTKFSPEKVGVPSSRFR